MINLIAATFAALMVWTVVYIAIVHDAQQKCETHYSTATCQEVFR